MFVWSVHNGATYYIDVFGKRFQNELEQLKKDVAKWQTSPEPAMSPTVTPKVGDNTNTFQKPADDDSSHNRWPSIDQIPMLDNKNEGTTGVDGSQTTAHLRK